MTFSLLDCEFRPKVATIRIFIRSGNSKYFERMSSKDIVENQVCNQNLLFRSKPFWHSTGPSTGWKS